jgi:hypothetical protein
MLQIPDTPPTTRFFSLIYFQMKDIPFPAYSIFNSREKRFVLHANFLYPIGMPGILTNERHG